MEISKGFLQSVTLYAIRIVPYELRGQPTTHCTTLLLAVMKHKNTWLSADVQCRGFQFVGPPASEEISSITIKTEARISAPFSTIQHCCVSFSTVQHRSALFSTVQYRSPPFNTVQYRSVLFITNQNRSVPFSTSTPFAAAVRTQTFCFPRNKQKSNYWLA
jgi:hypothetical protein